MRVAGLLLFAFIFLVVPFILLQAVLMPALNQLKYTYQNADTVTQTALQE